MRVVRSSSRVGPHLRCRDVQALDYQSAHDDVARRIETSKRAGLWQRVRDSTGNLSESKVTLGAVEVLGSLTMARSWLKDCDI